MKKSLLWTWLMGAVLGPLTVWATSFEEQSFSTLVSREMLMARAQKATADVFPDADTVTLHDGEHVMYDTEGRFMDVMDVCVKVLTERGRRDTRTQSLYYSAHYALAPRFVVVEVLHADGSVTPIDPATNTKERIDRSSMGSNIYDPNNKIVELTIPDLQIGDSLHLVVERENFKARVEKSWSDIALFEDTAPILYSIYEVQAPNELPIRSIQLRDRQTDSDSEAEYTTQELEKATLHRWEFRNVPQVFPEPSTPALYTCVQRLLLSTESDWRALSRWYDRLCQPRLEAVNEAMRKQVEELIEEVPDEQARIRVLFDFVSQQIRYMGITDEEVSPGYEPHDVSLTFDNRYGVCRDKAALLVAMLRLAGLKAHPVLISVGTRKDAEVPQPFFNHAIVCVDRGKGEGKDRYLLMDPTNEKSRDLFPSYLYNDDFLVASPEGETLLNAGPAPIEENLIRVRTRGELDATRALTLESVVAFDGINDSIYRNNFARYKPEERERFFEALLRSRLPGAELLSMALLPEDMGDTSRSLEATLRYRVPDVPVDGEGAWLIRLPWISPALGFSGRVLGSTGLEKRRFPLEILPTCGEEETIELTFANDTVGAPLSLPESVRVHSGALDFLHEATFEEKTLKAKRHMHLLAAQVEPEDYAALRTDLHTQERAARRQVVFAPSPSAVAAPAHRANAALPEPPTPDAEILSSDSVIELSSDHSWVRTDTRRTRILTYAGVKDRSEISFNYNPAFEKVEIVSAKVTAPDGSVQEVTPKEINEMDAGWTASAPRYPSGKTLVVSLPGVREGSMIETVIRTTAWDQPWFSAAYSFRGSDPILSSTLTVTLPEDAPFALRLNENDADHPATISTADGMTRYTWRFTGLTPLQSENHLPPSWLRSPAIQISSRSSYTPWQKEILARLAAMSRNPEYSSAARLKGAALALAPDGTALSREEAVRAIRDFVATSIRAAGPNFMDLPANVALTAPDVTLAEGYGHQADLILLLKTLLEGAGIADTEVVPVCTYSSESADLLRPLLDVPMTHAFAKLLLRVPDGTGEGEFWLGDTDQYSPLDSTPEEDSLALARDGSLMTIQPRRVFRPEATIHIALAEDGSAVMTQETRYTGASYGAFRKKYLEMRPEDRRRHHLELVGSMGRGALPQGDLVTDTESYPGVLSYASKVEGYAVRDGKMLYLSIPGLPGNPLGINSSKARENDFYLGPQSEVSKVQVQVKLPSANAKVLIAPPTEVIEVVGLGTIECVSTVQDGVLTVTLELRLKEGVVPADQYDALVALSERLQHPRFSTLLLELK